ncbi:hypothetical protein IL306_008236 [Fusarium sp. DS 682]|nr:hypothetical protein IL306_008236 [Fusarium sp. DS 682]
MATLPPPNYSDLELPSYDSSAAPNYTTPTTSARPKDSILGPATLYIAGRFIYSTDPQEAPLYEFSHDISYLHDNDRNVKVERIDPVTKTSAGLPQVVLKNRHLFDLKHPTAAEFPSFPYHAEATSQRALTSFGVSCFRSGNILRQLKGYRFERMVRGPGRKFRADGVLYEACESRSKGVVYEWRDCYGDIIAREVQDEQGHISMFVTAEMAQELRDALVVAWVIRIWAELSHGNKSATRLMMVGSHQ